MPAQGDQQLIASLYEALAAGPLDVMQILGALRARAASLVGQREGRVHALLQELLRRGEIHVVDSIGSGLARYARGPAEGTRAVAPTPSDEAGDFHRRAQRMAAGVRAPADRARITKDIDAHLARLAKKDRLSAFGSARNVRHLLRRTDRGRPVVLFPAGAGDYVRKFLVEEGPWILMAILAFLVIRAFLAEVFFIPSSSMVPTLLEGDRVVVVKPGAKGRMPERWSIVTFDRGGTTFVKRVIGLGGESVLLLGGDPYIDGELLVRPDDLRADLRTPYKTWALGSSPSASEWSEREDGSGRTFEYAGPTLWSGGFDATGRARFAADVPLRDVYATLEAERPSGGMVGLRLDFVPQSDASSKAHLALSVSDTGIGLTRSSVTAPNDIVIETLGGTVPAGRTVIHLAYVDGEVMAHVEGGPRVTRRLEPDQRPPRGTVVRPGFSLAGGASPRRLQLDRDHHYTLVGQRAVPKRTGDEDAEAYAHPVPEGTVFLLGDNSYSSKDCRFRDVGDIPVESLIGPVLFRIWPPTRIGTVR